MKNILIGNGVNHNSTCDLLTNDKILERFKCFFDLFLDDVKPDELKYEMSTVSKKIPSLKGNIEEVAAEVYEIVKESFVRKDRYFSGNNEQRIKNQLKKVALNAIFKTGNKRIDITINEEIVKKICKYENILSLNYYEYWDIDKRSKYLHGNIDFNGDEILNITTCVFSPLLNLPKSKSGALYPSKHLLPADDLCSMGEYPLYNEFKDINDIDIFGVSPIGDKELMEALKKVSNVKIYIFDLNSKEKEVDAWKDQIRQAVFLDSREF